MNRIVSHLSKSKVGDQGATLGSDHREIALRQPLNDVACAKFRVERTNQRGAMATPRSAESRSGGKIEPLSVLDVTVAAAVAAGRRSQ